VLVLFGMVVSTSVSEMSAHTGDYQARIQQLLEQIATAAPLERLGVRVEDFTAKVLSITQDMVAGALTGTVSGIMSIFSNGAMVLIFMIFMLIGKKTDTASVGGLLHEVEFQVKRYILTMVFFSGATGVLVGLTLWFLGVEFAWMFGFLAFLLNFIPNIGSLMATLLPLPVALMSVELSITAKVLALALPGAIQFVIGNVVQPKIMGGSLDLHPVVVLLSLIFFGMIWGVVGMFLATPITAVAKMFLEKGRFTEPVAHLLAGRLDVLAAGPAPPNAPR
jgi:AI-2 transport protein TqsA